MLQTGRVDSITWVVVRPGCSPGPKTLSRPLLGSIESLRDVQEDILSPYYRYYNYIKHAQYLAYLFCYTLVILRVPHHHTQLVDLNADRNLSVDNGPQRQWPDVNMGYLGNVTYMGL